MKTLLNITCNKERLHSWRWLWWFKKLIDVLLRKRGLSSALTLDIFLLTSLLILKIKQENQNSAGLTKPQKKFLFRCFQQTSKHVLKITLFNAIQVTTNNANAIHSLFQFTGNKAFPIPHTGTLNK